MKPYKIINDSMLNMLSHIEENSIDCIITDPPYELGFMGKSWDSTGIAFNPKTWGKCFKALKPGGYLLAFGGSRTFHRIACAIEDAGFELRDTIMYIYGSGFPKSMNISKSLSGYEKTGKSGSLGIRLAGMGKNYKQIEQEDKRKGKMFDSKCQKDEYELELTENAKKWEGWGTALKPAFEPIIMARKPIKTSVAENVLKNGVGGINIDECRVPANRGEYDIRHYTNEDIFMSGKQEKNSSFQVKEQPSGRFPANIIHDGSDEVVSGFPSEAGGGKESGYNFEKINQKNITNIITNIKSGVHYGDSGNASRFFYTAKASKKDRDEGLDTLEAVEIRGGGGRAEQGYDDNDEEQQRLKESAGKFGAVKTLKKNTHPTVKPCELMQYLVRLVAPKGATILDPFMGSGSTGKAVMFENRERNADYKFIGIDLEKEYCEIAEMRIDYALNKYEYDFKQELQESKEKGQLNLFDMEENL